jgi:hypothetical protein
MNLETLKSKMARANFAGGPKCTFWTRGVHTVGSWQLASSRHGLPRPCQLASFRDFGLFLGGNAKAWAGQAKACDAKAMPWLSRKCHGCQGMPRPRHVLPRHVLPRHATAKACYAKAMPWLPRHATTKACHSQGMPQPRHVMPRQCHGCQALPRLPRHATAKAMPWAAKACHGQGMGCQQLERNPQL